MSLQLNNKEQVQEKNIKNIKPVALTCVQRAK